MRNHLLLASALLGLPAVAAAQAVTTIPAPTIPTSFVDMDLLPAGPTTVAALNGVGSPVAANIQNIVLTPSTAAAGIYNTSPVGRALGLTAAGLELIDPPSGAFIAFNGRIDLAGPTTEIGFGIGDWVGPVVLDFYLGGNPVVLAFSSPSQNGLMFYYQMAGGTFDRVDVRASTTGGNWVFIDFEVAQGGTPSLGTSYCGPAVVNTSGSSAATIATGSTIAANNNVTLTALSMPANQFGFFLTSMTQGNVPNPGGSNGVLCLGGTIGRYVAAGQIKNSGAGGTFDLLLNLTQTPAGASFVAITAGQTWNFQAWFRDIGPMGQPQSNFTDGRSISFN